MPYQDIPLESLRVNRANDRHGELENETAAIAELFRVREAHMKKLAKDIVAEGGIYDAPLVAQDGDNFIVFDGNRRITCLKLIASPNRAPSQELQTFFQQLHDEWEGEFPQNITCQFDDDRDKIDAILFRRHTGSQGGVGQSDWDDRAKRNFIDRTGKGGKVNVADQVEVVLAEEGRLPERDIPRSTMNRLLSSEPNRERVGISIQNNRFIITHDRDAVVNALATVASDLANRRIVLGDLWDNEGKRRYLNQLENAGVLPTEEQRLDNVEAAPVRRRQPHRRGRPQARQQQSTLIPGDAPHVPFTANQTRIRAIWDELGSIRLDHHPNAISALLRILVELSVDDYLNRQQLLRGNENLSARVRRAADDLVGRGAIDQAYRDELERMRQHDELISIRSMQRYVHSADFAPRPMELITYWVRLNRFLIALFNH